MGGDEAEGFVELEGTWAFFVGGKLDNCGVVFLSKGYGLLDDPFTDFLTTVLGSNPNGFDLEASGAGKS